MSVRPNTSDAPRSPETPRDTGAAPTTTLIVTRRVALQVTLGAFAALAGTGVLEVGSRTHTGAAAEGETVKEIFRQALPNTTGKEIVVISVDYAPGAGSARHRHPTPVIAYVVRGAIVSQLDTQPPVTFREGDLWYEPPGTIHAVSRNASTTEAAKLLAVSVANPGQAVTEWITQ